MFTSFAIFNNIHRLRKERKENSCQTVQLIRKTLRNKANVLELPDAIFLKSFRLTKETFLYVLRLLDLPSGVRSTHIPPILQLAATLNLLGGGGYRQRKQVGSDWVVPMGQSTISVLSATVIKKMQSVLCPRMINFVPLESTKTYFLEKYKIPGVIGCIDGSHIRLLRPAENEKMFLNRDGAHSINAMVICDENTRIMAVNAKYGGSADDSFVWYQSDERKALEKDGISKRRSSWLLGDSGYPLEPFLLTPYRNANENYCRELYYNQVIYQTRSITERCIGRLKSRWRIILEERKCRYSPLKVVEIINVCAALHNICCAQNVPIPEDEIITLPNQTCSVHTSPTRDISSRESNRIRDGIRDKLFLEQSVK